MFPLQQFNNNNNNNNNNHKHNNNNNNNKTSKYDQTCNHYIPHTNQ